MAILSHHTGYDDYRFGNGKAVNVRPAFKAWRAHNPGVQTSDFYGINITQPKFDPSNLFPPGGARSKFMANTQHYGYQITAEHLVAVCYYARNHLGTHVAFEPWAKYAKAGGYCDQFRIPSPAEVLNRRFN